MLRWTTAGESHGQALIALIEQVPAGVPVNADEIGHHLAQHQQHVEQPTEVQQPPRQRRRGDVRHRLRGDNTPHDKRHNRHCCDTKDSFVDAKLVALLFNSNAGDEPRVHIIGVEADRPLRPEIQRWSFGNPWHEAFPFFRPSSAATLWPQ